MEKQNNNLTFEIKYKLVPPLVIDNESPKVVVSVLFTVVKVDCQEGGLEKDNGALKKVFGKFVSPNPDAEYKPFASCLNCG